MCAAQHCSRLFFINLRTNCRVYSLCMVEVMLLCQHWVLYRLLWNQIVQAKAKKKKGGKLFCTFILTWWKPKLLKRLYFSTSSSPATSEVRKRTRADQIEDRFKKDGKIHSFKQTDNDDDENNTWNGNSTQQMWSSILLSILEENHNTWQSIYTSCWILSNFSVEISVWIVVPLVMELQISFPNSNSPRLDLRK